MFLKAIHHQRHLAASEIARLDRLSRDLETGDLGEKIGSKLKNPERLLRSLLASVMAVLVLAQGASPSSEAPKLRGETLDDKSIVLPGDAHGKLVLLVLGTSRKGGERTGPWKDHFIDDFGVNLRETYYVCSLAAACTGALSRCHSGSNGQRNR
ncbi:MAG TPA: hypothetical protein VH437_03015 [Terriglobales bacterium]|jgi:hypothetical protein